MGGQQMRICAGRLLQVGNALLRLLQVQPAGAAQEIQLGGIRVTLSHAVDQRQRCSVVAASIERPHEAGPDSPVVRRELQRLAPLSCRFGPFPAFGAQFGSVNIGFARARQPHQSIVSLLRQLAVFFAFTGGALGESVISLTQAVPDLRIIGNQFR